MENRRFFEDFCQIIFHPYCFQEYHHTFENLILNKDKCMLIIFDISCSVFIYLCALDYFIERGGKLK